VASLQLSGIQLAFGDRVLLNNITFNLDKGKRAALTGGNGTGKSTLMKIMAGIDNADDGKVIISKNHRVAYLPQQGIIHSGVSLREEADRAFDRIRDLISEKESIEERLQGAAEGDGIEALLEKHHYLSEKVIESGYYHRDERIETVLKGLGFSHSDLTRSSEEFSGGWQMRIALAKVLLEAPDFLLLDEPTNYLDIEARDWLEGFLQKFPGGVLLVSHDRYFLDVTVSEVAELFNGNLEKFKGNYTGYLEKRELDMADLLKRYAAQQEEIARIENFVNRFRAQATKATQVQSRVKQLEKMVRIEIPESMKHIHFKFPDPPHSGNRVLKLDGVGRSYGDLEVFKDLDLEVEKGERLLIAGVNGAGKSTLMRLLAEVDKPTEGSITLGTDVKIGYFSQDIDSSLDGTGSVIEEMENSCPTHLIPSLRNLLGAFLFRGDDIFKAVSVLSGGEKSRLALLKLLLHPVNLLILDEPTNHLDMMSKDILMEALRNYTGTLLFVSHDRYFIEGLATKVLEMNPSGPKIFHGDYPYYLWKLEQDQSGDEANSDSNGQTKIQDRSNPSMGQNQSTSTPAGKSAREEEKRLKAQRRRLEKLEESLLLEIEELDTQCAAKEEELAKPEVYSDGCKSKIVQGEIAALHTKQEELTIQWETAAEELAALD